MFCLLCEFAERRKFYTEYVAFGKVFGIRIPPPPPQHISAVARRVLAQPRLRVGGRAQLVRLRGNQDDGARANGSRRRADKRVYCHEALHLKGKLQTAGYKQAVEKWDTDSDSDSSDEEDLKM